MLGKSEDRNTAEFIVNSFCATDLEWVKLSLLKDLVNKMMRLNTLTWMPQLFSAQLKEDTTTVQHGMTYAILQIKIPFITQTDFSDDFYSILICPCYLLQHALLPLLIILTPCIAP